MSSSLNSSPAVRPKGLLFDIGGVCVLSPMQAILDYEKQNGIPIGWINYSLQANSPNGAWHRLERGEIKVDETFFEQFNADFQRPEVWQRFVEEKLGTGGGGGGGGDSGSNRSGSDARSMSPPVIDGEPLFWSMMQIATTPDPYMFPALVKLRRSGQFVVGALSNTTILPDASLDGAGGSDARLRAQFDFFISSAHTGLRKPEPAIYEAAYEAMQAAARERMGWADGVGRGEIVFLDDIGVNLKGARNAGFQTIRVRLGRVQEAVRRLEELTGLRLLEEKGTVGESKL